MQDDTNPQPRYNPNQQPPVQLPDYRPRGMSTVDKIFVYLAASVVLIFCLVFIGRYLDVHIQPVSPPKAKATATAPAHAKAKAAAAAKKSGKVCTS
jgi:hypothetical protein